MDAFILAAGRGERLRPLTDTVPKPLVEVGDRTLIEHHLLHLAAAGCRRVIINLSWLGEKIRHFLGNGDRFGVEICYSQEPDEALETAGGIVHALSLIQSSEFILVNGDVLTNFNFQNLHIPSSSEAHLIMVDNPSHHPKGDFQITTTGLLNQGNGESFTYSGIACMRRRLFEDIDSGRRALRPILDQCIIDATISGEYFSGQWFDIGSPDRLEVARNWIRQNTHP